MQLHLQARKRAETLGLHFVHGHIHNTHFRQTYVNERAEENSTFLHTLALTTKEQYVSLFSSVLQCS